MKCPWGEAFSRRVFSRHLAAHSAAENPGELMIDEKDARSTDARHSPRS